VTETAFLLGRWVEKMYCYFWVPSAMSLRRQATFLELQFAFRGKQGQVPGLGSGTRAAGLGQLDWVPGLGQLVPAG
jgi:hypothetical protein